MLNISKITLRQRDRNRSGCLKTARIYIWPEGETILENLQNRRNRPYSVYKKEVLPMLFHKLHLDTEGLKVGWSKHAGCTMCPCSPGFVVKEGYLPFDIHVTVTDKYVSTVKVEGLI